MSKRCELCGKEPSRGNKVSHAHNLTKRRWLPNLQRVNAVVDGSKRHMTVCTKCLKKGLVVKSI